MNPSPIIETPKRQKITSQLFLKILKGEQAIAQKWVKNIKIIPGDTNSPSILEFSNLEIEGDIVINSEIINNHFLLINCRSGAFRVKDSILGSITISHDSKIDRFFIYSSKTKRIQLESAIVSDLCICDNSNEFLSIYQSKVDRLTFLESAFYRKPELSLSISEEDKIDLSYGIKITESTIGKIKIENIKLSLPFDIQSTEIKESFHLTGASVSSIKIDQSNIGNFKSESDSYILGKTSVYESEFIDFIISESTFGEILFNESRIKSYLRIRQSTTGLIKIIGSQVLNSLIVFSSRIYYLNIFLSLIKSVFGNFIWLELEYVAA